MAKNEFEEINEEVPSTEFSEVEDKNDLISAGSAGSKYDWTKAPEGVKAPPRINLDKKIVTIKKAEIILPPIDRDWQKSRDGKSEYKYCTFVLHYDLEGQQEFYSGCRCFKRDDNKYSHPTIMNDRKNQCSELKGKYSDFKQKDINEVSLREFMGFLNSQPKAKIKNVEIKNPITGEIIHKNLIDEFIK